MGRACFSGALFPRLPGCGRQCARLTISPPHLWEWRDFPFSDGHPAWKRTVGCTEYLGGFRFPGLGTRNSSAVLDLPGSDPRLEWQSYYDRLGEAKLDLLLLEPLRTQWTARDFAPDNIFGLVAFIEHNAEHGRPRRVVECLENLAVSGLEMSVCCMVTLKYSAVSGPARTLHTLAAVVSGVAMAYHPGAYAVQVASEAPPCAETAMERVASTRVAQWRSQWGLQDNTDFAYAFASYDSAEAPGGHHVADAWLQARSSSMDEDLIPQVAAAAESSGSKDRPASWPAPKASMLKKSKMVQALRIRPGPDQPEQVLLRAEALRKAFSQARVMRPQGELTPERHSQWQDALDTLAEL